MADQIYGVRCGFFDAVNNDRTYSADDMNKPYNRLVSDGVFAANEGTASTDFQVFAAGNSMNISVSRGAGIVAHKWFESGSTLLITVPANSLLTTRIDSVILQVDNRTTGRIGNVVYRTGTASPPDINTSSDVVELRVANIAVTPSATTISQENITDLRGSAECPWVAGLIQQLDTSTLWAQFNDAYSRQYEQISANNASYMQAQRQTWEDFIESLTQDLNVSTSVVTYHSVYTSLATVTSVPINIASFDSSTDVLLVYINGLMATPTVDYTIASNNQSITLTQAIEADQTVVFIALKSLVSGDMTSVVSLVQQLNDRITNITHDTGWFPIPIQSPVQAASANLAPKFRMIGYKYIFITGQIKNVGAGETIITTMSYRPAYDMTFTSAAVKSGNVIPVVITLSAETGIMTVKVPTGTSIDSTYQIAIDCNYINDNV